jgi:hypothetical protein
VIVCARGIVSVRAWLQRRPASVEVWWRVEVKTAVVVEVVKVEVGNGGDSDA